MATRRKLVSWQSAPVGVLAAVVSFLNFSSRLGASAACRAFSAAAKMRTSMPSAVVVRAPPPPCTTSRRLPTALWRLTQLQTLRVARLVCLATAEIAALQSLACLRRLTATFDIRAVWRFPTALETLELTCDEDCTMTQTYAPDASNSHAGVFARLSALRTLSIDTSPVSDHLFRLLPWPPNLTALDYVGPLYGVESFGDQLYLGSLYVVESVGDLDALASFRTDDYLPAWHFSLLGRRPALRRLHLSTFGVQIPHGAASGVAAGGLFAALRDLTFSWVGGNGPQRMSNEVARMPALETLCIQDFFQQSLHDLTRVAGGFRTLTTLSITDADSLTSLAGIGYFAATLRTLDLSRTGVRETSDLGDLTQLARLRLDDVRPTVGKNITFPGAPLPSVRQLSVRGSAHWHWTAHATFPNADIAPPLTGTEADCALYAPTSVCSGGLV